MFELCVLALGAMWRQHVLQDSPIYLQYIGTDLPTLKGGSLTEDMEMKVQGSAGTQLPLSFHVENLPKV